MKYNALRYYRYQLEFNQWALVELRRLIGTVGMEDRYRDIRKVHLDCGLYWRERIKSAEHNQMVAYFENRGQEPLALSHEPRPEAEPWDWQTKGRRP